MKDLTIELDFIDRSFYGSPKGVRILYTVIDILITKNILDEIVDVVYVADCDLGFDFRPTQNFSYDFIKNSRENWNEENN